MDIDTYNSQQAAIAAKAKERGVDPKVLDAVFDQKFDAIVQEHPGTRPNWRLGRAEYLFLDEDIVQQLTRPHQFPTEPFPGSVKSSDSDTSKMSRNRGLRRANEMRDTSNDWVHDKFRADSPSRNDENNGNRRPDHYDGPGRRYLSIDSYKPDGNNSGYYRDDARDATSYRPSSRDRREQSDDSHSGIKASAYYKSVLGSIADKAFGVGITPESFCGAYYRCGEKAKKDKPLASAYWIQWRQECMIWKQFFSSQGFIGAEPKLKPTTKDTEPANFTIMDGAKLWGIFKASPAFGRLTNDNGLAFPPRKSDLPKSPVPSTAYYNSAAGGQHNLHQQSQLVRSSTPTHGSQIILQTSELLKSKALAHRVSSEKLQAILKEKQKLVKAHFSDQAKEWQHWAIEATTWGHLFKDTPFPLGEPRLRDSKTTTVSSHDTQDRDVSDYTTQEKAMEQMAIKKGIRREFFQYLNTTRHDAIIIHPLCTCYARRLLADRLTWRKFFRESSPVPYPSQDHGKDCPANIKSGPFSSAGQVITAPSKSPTVNVEGREYRGSQRPTSLETPHQQTPNIKSEEHKTVAVDKASSTGASMGSKSRRSEAGWDTATVVSHRALPPPSATSQNSTQVPTSDVRLQKLEHQNAPYSSEFASTRRPTQISGPHDQGTNIYFTSAQISLQPPKSKTSTTTGARLQNSNAEYASKELPEPTAKVCHEIMAPVSIMTALTDVRRDNSIPDGAVVMQNMDSTICKTENVTQMARCLLAESAVSITSISNGLKCHFRYKQIWNGDLVLWVEPYSLGDTVAFSGGHLFLKGWVQRNLSFGVVKPSFYWNEIKNHPGFKQAAMSPPPKLGKVSPSKSELGNSTPSEKAPEGATDNTEKENNAALIIRGSYVENVPCSGTALKNLVYSFFIDNSKEKVERRLRCTLSLSEPANKSAGSELQLEMQRAVATDGDVFNKATRFLHAWAMRAMKSALCKPSTFLISSKGLQILGKSEPAVLASDDSGQHSRGRERTESPYNASDLDLLLSEETAKAEGSSRLVLDDATGDVVTLRELLRKTLERASAKMLESSVPPSPHPLLTPNATENDEDEEDEEGDDEVRVFGTDGQMKDMGGGRFIVVKGQKKARGLGNVAAKRKLQEDQDFGKRAEKKVCVSKEMDIVRKEVYEKDPDMRKPAEKSIFVSVMKVVECEEPEGAEVVTPPVNLAESPKHVVVEESSVSPSENSPRAVDVSVSAKGKRKAEESELGDHAEKKVCV